MENIPRSNTDTGEIGSKAKESTKKASKKEAKSFGALVVEKQPPSEGKKPSLFGLKKEDGKGLFARIENIPEQPTPPKAEKPDKLPELSPFEGDPAKLSKEEQRFAAVSAVNELEKQAPEHPVDDVEAHAEQAAAEYRQAVREADGDLAVADQVMAEKGYDTEPAEIEAEDLTEPDETVPETIDTEPEIVADVPEADEDDPTVPAPTAPTMPAATATAAAATHAATAPPHGPTGAVGGGTGGGSTPGGAGTPPPRGPGAMPPFGGGVPGGPTGPVGPATAAAIVNPFNHAPVTPVASPNVIVNQGNTAGAFLLGGVVGYFIGRRRGRIKAEKQLKPVRKKLEKQVESLQHTVQTREATIREAARQKARAQKAQTQPAQKVASPEKSVVAPVPIKHEKPAEIVTPAAAAAVAPAERPKDEPAETVFIKSPERVVVGTKPEAPTHLGKMIVTAEAATLLKPLAEVAAARAAAEISKPPAITAEQAQSVERKTLLMNRTELLQMAETVVVDGSSLRQIYETKLVGEQGLRRLIEVHLRGGDIKKQLNREIVEREIDFERDPIMRDKAAVAQAAIAGGTATTLQTMLKKADAGNNQKQEEVAFLKARAEHKEKELVREQQKRRMLDVSLVTVIAVLTGFIIVLIMGRI